MHPDEVVEEIVAHFPDIVPKVSWGETSLFYNPGKVLPNGVYFCTIKEHDGDNDKSSNLNREEVFRLAIGLDSETYFKLFGQKPSRPQKGVAVKTVHDFTKLNELMPHPVYAWMNWAQVLCPTRETLKEIFPLIEKAFQSAVCRFDKKTATKPKTRKG